MKSLLLICIGCLLILTWTETIAEAVGYALILSALVWLINLLRQEIRQNRTLARRRISLQARWAILVRHLSGLPLPVDTPASLFYAGEQLILETEQEQWIIAEQALGKILLIAAEQLRHVNDHQLCRMLHCSDRTFFALRDKLRHHDSSIRHVAILILSYQPQPNEQSILVLVSSSRARVIAALLRACKLREKSLIQLPQKKQKKPVKQKGENELCYNVSTHDEQEMKPDELCRNGKNTDHGRNSGQVSVDTRPDRSQDTSGR